MGGRLRLSDAWYQANRANFSPINQAILDALHTYGGFVDDLSNAFSIDGVNDKRWNATDLLNLESIPVTAFEVVDTIKSPLTFSGPTSGTVGNSLTYTLQYTLAADSNFDSDMFVQLIKPDGSWVWAGEQHITDGNRSMTTSFTPTVAGTYTLHLFSSIAWLLPADITVTVTAAATPAAQKALNTSTIISGIEPLLPVVETTAKSPAPGKQVVSLSTSAHQANNAPSQPKLTVAMSLTSAEPGVKPWVSPTVARFRSKKPASRLGMTSSLSTVSPVREA
jgi:hypothetical protein